MDTLVYVYHVDEHACRTIRTCMEDYINTSTTLN